MCNYEQKYANIHTQNVMWYAGLPVSVESSKSKRVPEKYLLLPYLTTPEPLTVWIPLQSKTRSHSHPEMIWGARNFPQPALLKLMILYT